MSNEVCHCNKQVGKEGSKHDFCGLTVQWFGQYGDGLHFRIDSNQAGKRVDRRVHKRTAASLPHPQEKERTQPPRAENTTKTGTVKNSKVTVQNSPQKASAPETGEYRPALITSGTKNAPEESGSSQEQRLKDINMQKAAITSQANKAAANQATDSAEVRRERPINLSMFQGLCNPNISLRDVLSHSWKGLKGARLRQCLYTNRSSNITL